MPIESEAQRRYLWATNPELARRFEDHTPKGKKLPKKKHPEKTVKKEAGLLQQPPSPIQQADAKVLAATGKKPETAPQVAQQPAQAAQPKQAGIKYTKQELEMLKALRDMARLKHLTQAHREGRLPAHMLDRIKTPDHERWWKQASYSSLQGAQDQVAAGQARANAQAVGRDMYGMPLPKPQIAKTPTPAMAKKGQYSTPFDQWELHNRFRALLGLHALA